MENNMTYEELERDYLDYKQVHEESLKQLLEAESWLQKSFDRMYAAKKALENFKKEFAQDKMALATDQS